VSQTRLVALCETPLLLPRPSVGFRTDNEPFPIDGFPDCGLSGFPIEPAQMRHVMHVVESMVLFKPLSLLSVIERHLPHCGVRLLTGASSRVRSWQGTFSGLESIAGLQAIRMWGVPCSMSPLKETPRELGTLVGIMLSGMFGMVADPLVLASFGARGDRVELDVALGCA